MPEISPGAGGELIPACACPADIAGGGVVEIAEPSGPNDTLMVISGFMLASLIYMCILMCDRYIRYAVVIKLFVSM